MYGESPVLRKEKRRVYQMQKMNSDVKGNNDSFAMHREETEGWTRLEEVPHEDGWSDHKTDMSI